MSVPAIRGFQPSIQDPNSLRDAIVAIRRDNLSVRNSCKNTVSQFALLKVP